MNWEQAEIRLAEVNAAITAKELTDNPGLPALQEQLMSLEQVVAWLTDPQPGATRSNAERDALEPEAQGARLPITGIR